MRRERRFRRKADAIVSYENTPVESFTRKGKAPEHLRRTFVLFAGGILFIEVKPLKEHAVAHHLFPKIAAAPARIHNTFWSGKCRPR